MIDELGRVLHKSYLRQHQRWTDAQISEYLTNLMEMSDFVSVSESVEILDRDPTDSFSLDCAVQARADLIVSGDPDLIELGSYQGIPIVTLVECIARIRAVS